MYNWPVTISLLLRESEELISSALRPSQSAILLRMFVHCAVDLNRRRTLLAGAGVSLSANDRHFLQSWEALNEHLLRSLSSLLVRFKDDEANLLVLVDIVPCCTFTAAAASSAAESERALKTLLKIVMDLFQITRDEKILSVLVGTLCTWAGGGGGGSSSSTDSSGGGGGGGGGESSSVRGGASDDAMLAGVVRPTLQKLVGSCWAAIEEGTARLQELVSQSKNKGGKGKHKHSKGEHREDRLLAQVSKSTEKSHITFVV
jgi:hypothetical protein